MPSPFTRRPANTSTVDVDRPVAVTPVPERVRGHNFAYRGYETHGVPPENDNHDVENYGWMEEQRGVTVDFEPAVEPPAPIPVRIVQDRGRELKRFRCTRMTVTADVRNVLGADPLRRKVNIKNTSADTVYIGHDQQSASAMHGWPLAQNESIPVDATAPVFAGSSTTNACVLAFLVEYSTVDGGTSDNLNG